MSGLFDPEQLRALALLALRATVLLSLAHLALSLMRRRSACAREAVGRWFLLALVLLPALACSGWSIGLLRLPADRARAADPQPVVAGPSEVLPADLPTVPEPLAPPAWSLGDVGGWVALAWLVGAGLLLANVAIGHLVAARRLLGSGARPLPDALRRRLGLEPGLALLNPRATQPVVAGLWRPRIVLPEVFAEWDPARQEAVLSHERAHVERRDGAAVVLRQIARAIWWPHPLVWLLDRRLSLLCEKACDDRVLDQGVGATAYAEALVDVARELRDAGPAHRHVLAMTTTTQLEARVRALLRSDVNRARPRAGVRLAAASLTLSLGLLCATGDAIAQDPVVPPPAEEPREQQPNRPEPLERAPKSAVIPRNGKLEEGVMLAVNEKGEVHYGDEVIGVAGVQPTLERLFADGARPVLVKASPKTRSSLLLRVIDEAKAAGAIQVSIATGTKAGGKPETAPRAVYRARPEITAAMREQLPVTVQLQCVIDVNGRATAIKVQSATGGDASFPRAAVAALKQWRFEPATKGGKPIARRMRIPMTFGQATRKPARPLSAEEQQQLLQRLQAELAGVADSKDLAERLHAAYVRKLHEAANAEKEAADILQLMRDVRRRVDRDKQKAGVFGSISGSVEDRDFELPLPDALVQVAETGDRAKTSKTGRFRLEKLPPGTYTLTIRKPGYQQQALKVEVVRDEVVAVDVSMAGAFADQEPHVVGNGK